MKQKRKRLCGMVAALLCATMLCVPAFAAPSLAAPSSYCYDGAGVLTDATKQMIEQQNAALDAACGAQIEVVIVNDTEGYSLEQYTYEIFNAWGIGDKKKNNGVLLILDIAGDDYQCLQGSGLESTLPTPTLSRILREDLEPDFAARDYDAGVQKTFATLVGEVARIYNVDTGALGTVGGAAAGQTQPGQTGGTHENNAQNGYNNGYNDYYEESDWGGLDIVGMIVFLFVVILVISSVSGTTRRKRYGSNNAVLPFLLGLNMRPYRRYDSRHMHRHNHTPPPFNPGDFNGGFSGGGLFGGGSSHGGGFGGGFGGFGGGGGGGGFGGFGGGGSRGGGAGRGH